MRDRRYEIILVGVMVLAALACGLPLAAGSPTGAPTTLTTPAVAQTLSTPITAPTASAVATPEPTDADVLVYLVALEDSGKNGIAVGCGDSLVAVVRPPVSSLDQPVRAALETLFAIKQQHFGQSGLYNALWQSDLRVESVTLDGQGGASVSLTGSHLLGGECDTPRFKGQIMQTILSAPGVKSASVLLDGKPIDQALSLK